jgi:hypothetical protein
MVAPQSQTRSGTDNRRRLQLLGAILPNHRDDNVYPDTDKAALSRSKIACAESFSGPLGNTASACSSETLLF